MEEMEVPMEHLHEKIHEEAHAQEHKPEGNWIVKVALSTAIVSVLAALTSLFAGHFANEAMIEQIRASDQWAFYQAKGIKAEVKSATAKLLTAQGHAAEAEDATKIEEYKKEQIEIKSEAEHLQAESKAHLAHHGALASALTLFQISIAISAISILTKQKPMWFLSLILAAIGAAFFTVGFL